MFQEGTIKFEGRRCWGWIMGHTCHLCPWRCLNFIADMEPLQIIWQERRLDRFEYWDAGREQAWPGLRLMRWRATSFAKSRHVLLPMSFRSIMVENNTKLSHHGTSLCWSIWERRWAGAEVGRQPMKSPNSGLLKKKKPKNYARFYYFQIHLKLRLRLKKKKKRAIPQNSDSHFIPISRMFPSPRPQLFLISKRVWYMPCRINIAAIFS